MKETKFNETEVGMIPSDWEVKTIKDLGVFLGGGTPSTKNESFWKGSIPWISSADLNDDDIEHISTTRFITQEAVNCSATQICPQGTILIIARVGVGKLALSQQKVCTSQDFCNLIPSKENDSKFLAYALLPVMKQMANESQGTSIKGVAVDEIKKVQIIVPSSKAEQTAIANALSDVDSLIANLEKLIAKKKNIKQGAMQQLLTGKKRLPGFGGKWNKKVISKLGYTYNGLSGKIASDFGKGSAQYITFLNVLNNPVVDKHLFQKVNVSEAENQNKVLKDDLLFNTSSEVPEEVGICSVLKAEVPNLYLNSFCFGFRLTDNAVDGLFLSYYFRSSLGRNLMSLLAQGSTRYNLSKDNFLKSSIVIPSTKEEQTAIANVLSNMDTEISALETKLAKYRTLKTGMMQQLLTGKIRLI